MSAAVRSATQAPVIEAVRRNGQLVFCCDYCLVHHHHGAGRKPGDGDGHRVAHCALRASPYRDTGYYLREIPGAAVPGPKADSRWHMRQWGAQYR